MSEQPDRFGTQDAHAIEFPAVHQHLTVANHLGGRPHQAATGCFAHNEVIHPGSLFIRLAEEANCVSQSSCVIDDGDHRFSIGIRRRWRSCVGEHRVAAVLEVGGLHPQRFQDVFSHVLDVRLT